ncbi:hypothetical protein E4T49_08452 [Aureobasidium sp. EXF-10728]|nr:hypothetical protein E4T49_08452 [Aureobasidium sp. EXF-10728]
MTFTITASLFRILLGLPIFLLGFRAIDILNRPLPLTRDLSTILSNQTLTLALPGFNHTTIATVYVPTSLYDHGRSSIFWGGLLALACAGAYIIGKAQHHVLSQLLELDEVAKNLPRAEKLGVYVRGLRGLDLKGWVFATGPRDTFMAWGFSVSAVGGVLYPSIVAGFQNFASDNVASQLEWLSINATTNDTVFGNSSAHGRYTLETWTCQIAPLVSGSTDTITLEGAREVLRQSCRDAHTSRYLMLIMLPLTILMVLSIARPQWFSFGAGGGEKAVWMTVPLEDADKDVDSDGDEDSAAGFGGNAREQWQLD